MSTHTPDTSGRPDQLGAGQDAGLGAGAGPTPPPVPPPTASPVPPSGAPMPPQGPSGFFAAVRRTGLYRSDQRWIGGVAGGLAARLGVDPLLVRGLFAASIILGGLGLVVYGAAWALLPEQRDGRIHLEETIRGRFDAALLGAIAFVVLGLPIGDRTFGWSDGGGLGWFTGGIALTATIVVVVLLISSASKRGASGPQQPSPYGPFPQPGQPGTPPAYGTPPSSFAAPGPHGLYGAPPAPRYSPPPYAAPAYVPPAYVPPANAVPPVPSAAAAPASVSLASSTRAPGPGSAVVGTVVALTLLTLATLLTVDRAGTYDGPILLTTAAVAVVLLGVGIMVSGLRGRRSGVLGFFAIVSLLVAAPLAAGEQNDWDVEWNWTTSDQNVVVTTRAQAESGFSVGAGDATIDLTGVPLTGTTLDVPLHVGVGSLTVIVPEDVAVVADVTSGVGDITWDVGDNRSTTSGAGNGQRSYASDEVDDSTDPQLALDVSVGAGDITIKEP